MKRLLVWLGLLLLTTSLTTAQDAVLRVDASQSLGIISPYVYGSNLGQQSVIPPSLMPQAQALGLNYVRYGGGESDRRNLLETTVDLFIYQVRQLGADPALTVRLLGGTPEQAADMVRYTNIEKDYGIRYWSIGNEPNIYPDTMGVPYTIEDLNRDWRAIAEAMLAADPTILFVGPDITQYVVLSAEPDNIQYLERADGGHPRDSAGRDWLQEFLRANGDLVDVVSIHRYPYPGAGGSGHAVATIDGLQLNSREWDTIIPNLRRVIRDAAGRDIPIAVSEINSNSSNSSGGEASLDSLYNALWFADVLGRLIRQQVEIVAYWDLQGPVNRSWGLLTSTGVRPTYYVYIMYSHFGVELLVSESADPDVSLYAAKREDGTLTLMVVNLGSEERSIPLEVTGFVPSGPAEVWRLDAEHHAEPIGLAEIRNGATATVPGQSMTLYAVPGQLSN